MSQTIHQLESSAPAQTLPPILGSNDDALSRELFEHIHRLRLILPVISVSVMALHRQDAESDADIASVLSEHACEPLDTEIERMESLLTTRAWRRRQEELRQ